MSARFPRIYKKENPPLERVPLPLGEGGAKRRVRVRMPKLFVVRPHPALRATFSRREKDPPRQFVYYFGQLCVIDRPYRKSHRHRL